MVKDTGLFTPYQLGPTKLKNRIVMAPMTRNRAGSGNVPGELTAVYYSQRSSGGLIITEGTQISPQGVGYPATPGIHSPEQVQGWRLITDSVHGAGGKIFPQLWHVGRISHPSLQPGGDLPVAPSVVKPEGEAFTYEGLKPFVPPRALETGEIPGIVEQYRQAALNAMDAGFDGVEIHGANGYLIDQFLRDGSNLRTDDYGGPPDNRTRFLLEVVDAVSGVWGADRVGVRISPMNPFNSMSDSDPEATFTHVAGALRPLGLAYLHVVEAAISEEGITLVDFHYESLKDAFGGTYIANGGYTRERAEAVLEEGRAELVSFGASYLANPDLPEKLMANAPLNDPDPSTFYGGDEAGYTDYPFL
jgi:N-ethylmaleimide reductase